MDEELLSVKKRRSSRTRCIEEADAGSCRGKGCLKRKGGAPTTDGKGGASTPDPRIMMERGGGETDRPRGGKGRLAAGTRHCIGIPGVCGVQCAAAALVGRRHLLFGLDVAAAQAGQGRPIWTLAEEPIRGQEGEDELVALSRLGGASQVVRLCGESWKACRELGSQLFLWGGLDLGGESG